MKIDNRKRYWLFFLFDAIQVRQGSCKAIQLETFSTAYVNSLRSFYLLKFFSFSENTGETENTTNKKALFSVSMSVSVATHDDYKDRCSVCGTTTTCHGHASPPGSATIKNPLST